MPEKNLQVTEIGEYIRYHSCQRRFKLRYNNYQAVNNTVFSDLIFQTSLDPALEQSGRISEQKWAESLNQSGFISLTTDSIKQQSEPGAWDKFRQSVQYLPLNQLAYAREIKIQGKIGNFKINGQIDFILIIWKDNKPFLRLVECKASRKDRTYHRIQIAVYLMLIKQLLSHDQLRIGGQVLSVDSVDGVVARIDEKTNEIQDIPKLTPIDFLSSFETDLTYLLQPSGELEKILETNLDDLPYQLDAKCSDCVLSVHCLAEGARQRRLHLLGIDPATIRSLNAVNLKTIDDLADLDLNSQIVDQLQQDLSFKENLKLLQAKAKTRRSTLPHHEEFTHEYQVSKLPQSSAQQTLLPLRVIDNVPLIRVYLSVEYDYVENRLVALSAHITNNANAQLDTKFATYEGKKQPVPIVQEIIPTDNQENPYREEPLQAKDVIVFQPTAWTGDYNTDTLSETKLIHSFFNQVQKAIHKTANTDYAPIHFYIWSRQEMTQLIEGCSRCGSQLLSHLKELMGCRRKLEQQIYTCLDSEIDRCYALGWTGRDITVVTSLTWFGHKYHWLREIKGQPVFLDRQGAFWRDIFDFLKYPLFLDSQGQWLEKPKFNSIAYQFEIRLRYFNSVSAAYWRGYWGTLPDPTDEKLDAKARKAITNYNNASKPDYLKTYLVARTQALRWIEERFPLSLLNKEIEKPPIDLSKLSTFSLGVNSVALTSVHFLQLDHYVKLKDWISTHLTPPLFRLNSGLTLPIKDVMIEHITSVNQSSNPIITATINFDYYQIAPEVIETNSTLEVDSFVRITPCDKNPQKGQTIKQLTTGIGFNGIINSLDWKTGQVKIKIIFSSKKESSYILKSNGTREKGFIFPFATIDESPSNFSSERVEFHLEQNLDHYICTWFDPTNPQIPPQTPFSPQDFAFYQKYLQSLILRDNPLHPQQLKAILDGLNSTVQLLLGPPGTGKTNTTAIATFLRIIAHCKIGDIVLITAPTHAAVNILMLRIDEYLDDLQKQLENYEKEIPKILLYRDDKDEAKNLFKSKQIELCDIEKSGELINQKKQSAVLVIGSTVTGILKMAKSITGLKTPLLIVDEASMMVFPHFLAVATLVTKNGQIMLAGDHRQLAPIVNHKWEGEDRPPIILYQPYVSAYQAVNQLKESSNLSNNSLCRSALTFTFRLPQSIRQLISPLYKQLDQIDLEGYRAKELSVGKKEDESTGFSTIWQEDHTLFLVVHNETSSSNSNPFEIKVIMEILNCSPYLKEKSVAIITPHRCQKTQLKTSLSGYDNQIKVIDTVEKMQGGECANIFISATVSDPITIGKNVDFILDLNRSNVAFSRVQERLIIIVSQSLLNYIPSQLENYKETLLWKELRLICSQQIALVNLDKYEVKILVPNKDD